MDVFLVPVGPARDELYCEIEDAPSDEGEEPRGGPIRRLTRRLVHGFRQMLAAAEEERRAREAGMWAPQADAGWLRRARTRAMRWIAEAIAEQRLLWHLRRETEVVLVHPDDLAAAPALEVVRAQLRRDYHRHRFWLAIDALGLIVSGLLVWVPGPNFLAYYFAFRVVGHYLSLRGARQGLERIRWTFAPNRALTELRWLAQLEPAARADQVHEIEARLGLERLASFFNKTAVRLPVTGSH
jgi:hypothetical protein